ncbi:MAG: methylmalonyl-CoA epimerase [Bacteroidetes bacterium]|nr:methylmalonyl-CoA epimerase [Bacteroidota bacterium]
MVIKIDHIGIAVRTLEQASPLFEKLLGEKPFKSEEVHSEGVNVSFFRCGETKIELLESSMPGSTLEKFLVRKGEGVHHIAFETDNIKEEMARMKEAGFSLLHEEPRIGADNKLVCFIHPKSAGGLLVEICQERDKQN